MKKILFALMAMMLVGLLAGCGGGDKKAADKKADAPKANTKKELIVGTEPGFAPFEFQDEKTKQIEGFDMDIIRALAKKMGYEKCTINSMGFDALIPALEAKTIDVAASGMTITEERAKKVNFTKSYYKSGLAIVVRKDEAKIKTLKDLEGKTIGVQIGTTGAMTAGKVKNAKVKSFNTPGEACLEMKNKGADAVINDLPVVQWFLVKSKGSEYAKIVGDVLSAEDYGFATSKKNAELGKNLDKALEDLKKSGEYDKIYTKWFGSAPKK